jgi:hypothetical protein
LALRSSEFAAQRLFIGVNRSGALLGSALLHAKKGGIDSANTEKFYGNYNQFDYKECETNWQCL